MAVTEEIVLQDGVSGAANSAASATLAMARAMQQAQAASKALNSALQAEANGSNRAEHEMVELASAADKASARLKSMQDMLRNTASAEQKLGKGAAAAAKGIGQGNGQGLLKSLHGLDQITGLTGGKIGPLKEGLSQLGIGGAAGGVAAAGILAVTAAAAAGITALGGLKDGVETTVKALLEVHKSRDAWKRMLDQVTRGGGAQALNHLTEEARALGIPVENAVEQFIALRKGGLNNVDSQNVIKLRADLDAVGVSGADADKAIAEVVRRIKSGEDAGKVISDMAGKFGAVGDGSNAAAQNLTGFDGAINKLKGSWDAWVTSLDQSSTFDAIGDSLSGLFDSIANSDSVESLGNTFESALGDVPGIIDNIKTGFEAFDEAISPAIDRMGSSLNELTDALGSTEEGSDAAANAGSALGTVLGFVADGIGGLAQIAILVVEAFAAIDDAAAAVGDALSAAGTAIGDAFSAAWDTVSTFVSDAYSAGADIVAGIADGITSAASAVLDAITGVVSGGIDAAKSLLGISSPSKVFAEIGAQTGAGFTGGVDASATAAQSAMMDLVAPPDNPPANTNGGGSTTINVTINANGSNASADEIAVAVRREIESSLRLRGVA